MSDERPSLAWGQNGDPIDVPDEAMGWRVRRLGKGRGAPELVYDAEGLPLILPITATVRDLAEYGDGVPGRYRLDPVDASGRAIPGAVPAYVVLHPGEEGARDRGEETSDPRTLDTLERLSRQLVDLSSRVVSSQASVINATAQLVAAIDRTGLPRREPPEVEVVSSTTASAEAKEPTWLRPLIEMLGPQVVPGLMGMLRMLVDLLKANAAAQAPPSSANGVAA